MEIVSALRKLQGRGFDELRTRSVQAIAVAAERSGLSSQVRVAEDATFLRIEVGGDFSTAEGLLEHFRTRSRPHFFPSFAERAAVTDLLRERWPAQLDAAVERADCAARGRFDLLGREGLDFGDPIDWQFEPLSGRSTPLVHWSRIDHLDPERVGEYKITWELNRHQHFLALGQAYWYTADERYAATFAKHLTSWMDANPPKRGINWSSSLEVSLRAIAWIWALHFFRDSPHLTPLLFLRALKTLQLHGRHLETFLSTYYSPNTHLTGEALGLFYLGTVFPELRGSTRCTRSAMRILLRQLEVQIHPDGVYFEQASYYHRYTVDFYTHLLVLCRQNRVRLPDRVTERLQALVDHLLWIMRPDGTTPLYGDDDGGRLVTLERRAPNDFRAALSTSAALFARSDYRHMAGTAAAETLWLLGTSGIERFDAVAPHPPRSTSRAFADGGYFVMRDGWSRDSNYLLVHCGPHGSHNCGHAHADALAYDLVARGASLLVDPGTFTYIYPPATRDHFRSTGAHNAVTVDGLSSSIPAGPFQWEKTTRCELKSWIAGESFALFSGTHDGFSRPGHPARHTRNILFLNRKYWVVLDTIGSRGDSVATLHLQFAPGARPTTRGGRIVATLNGSSDSPTLDIVTFGGSGPFRCSEGWVSPSFGERVSAPRCAMEASGREGVEMFTFLLPRAAAEAPVNCQEVAADAGRGFLLERGADSSDLLLATDFGDARYDVFRSDFSWSWLRTEDGEVHEFVLIGGSRLEVEGRELVRSERPLAYVAGRRDGGLLQVETDIPDALFVDPLGAGEVRVNGDRPGHPIASRRAISSPSI